MVPESPAETGSHPAAPYVPDPRRALAIIERAYRGALETQYSDALYCAFLFHRHLGGLDVLLRGPAVTHASHRGRTPQLRLGKRTVTTLNDPRGGVEALLRSGVRVWAEEPALRAHGLDPDNDLLAGVGSVAAGVMATRWPDYHAVFYL
ncbi:hypothetical protein [Streptomyces sp. NPDC059161]|uniref:hypothetical protein n=1 Tax=unclassified Streptomyces TaxID=2593676 RepID=UPI00364E1A00